MIWNISFKCFWNTSAISFQFADLREHVIETALRNAPVYNLEFRLLGFDSLENVLRIKILKRHLVHELSVELAQFGCLW